MPSVNTQLPVLVRSEHKNRAVLPQSCRMHAPAAHLYDSLQSNHQLRCLVLLIVSQAQLTMLPSSEAENLAFFRHHKAVRLAASNLAHLAHSLHSLGLRLVGCHAQTQLPLESPAPGVDLAVLVECQNVIDPQGQFPDSLQRRDFLRKLSVLCKALVTQTTELIRAPGKDVPLLVNSHRVVVLRINVLNFRDAFQLELVRNRDVLLHGVES